MARYTWRCPEDGAVIEFVGSMHREWVSICPECYGFMQRVYKPIMTVAYDPGDVLTDWMDHNYRLYRARKNGKRAPRFSPHRVKRPVNPIPATAWGTRKRARS